MPNKRLHLTSKGGRENWSINSTLRLRPPLEATEADRSAINIMKETPQEIIKEYFALVNNLLIAKHTNNKEEEYLAIKGMMVMQERVCIYINSDQLNTDNEVIRPDESLPSAWGFCG